MYHGATVVIYLAASGLVCAHLAHAQDVTIRTNVPLVVLPTTVMDKHAHFVHGLTVDDFVVLDNNQPCVIKVDAAGRELAPISMVVAVQSNGISAAALAKLRKVGAMIPLAVTGEGGEAALLAFDSEIRVVQDFTGDAALISDAFEDLQTHGNTEGPMIDAVAKAVDMLNARPEGHRKTLLLISESRDRGSQLKFSELLPKVQRSGITVYSMTYSVYAMPFSAKPGDTPPSDGTGLLGAITEPMRLAKVNAAEALTAGTGGRHLSFLRQKGLENELMDLGKEIHSQYLISFTPNGSADRNFHRIEVHVKNRPDVQIRTKPGYWP